MAKVVTKDKTKTTRKKKNEIKIDLNGLTKEQALSLISKVYDNIEYAKSIGIENLTEEQKKEFSILEKVEMAHTLLLKGKEEFESAFTTMGEINDEIVDIKHQIELMENPTVEDKVKWFDELRAKQKERRVYKDIVIQLKPLYEFLKKEENIRFVNLFSQTVGEVRKVVQHCNNKFYKVRVRDDLDENIAVAKQKRTNPSFEQMLNKYFQDYEERRK